MVFCRIDESLTGSGFPFLFVRIFTAMAFIIGSLSFQVKRGKIIIAEPDQRMLFTSGKRLISQKVRFTKLLREPCR